MPVSSPSSPNIDQPTQDPSCLRVGKVSDGTFSRWSPSTTGDDFIEVSALDEGAHSGPQWLLIIRGHGQRRRSIVRPSTPARSPMIPCAMFRLVSSLHPMDFVRGPRPDAMMRQRHHPRFLRLSARTWPAIYVGPRNMWTRRLPERNFTRSILKGGPSYYPLHPLFSIIFQYCFYLRCGAPENPRKAGGPCTPERKFFPRQ